MTAPSVYSAINGISAELAKCGLAKNHVNEADDYRYRSIDDLFDRPRAGDVLKEILDL